MRGQTSRKDLPTDPTFLWLWEEVSASFLSFVLKAVFYLTRLRFRSEYQPGYERARAKTEGDKPRVWGAVD